MSLQLTLFHDDVKWTPPDMAALPDWNKAHRVCIDAETRDEDLPDLGIGVRRGAYTVGWSITLESKSGEQGPSFYLPTRHGGGGNLEVSQVHGYLAAQSKNFTGEIVGANLDYDLDFALEDGMTFANVKQFKDIQIAEPIIYELYDSYSLEAIGANHGIVSKNEATLKQALIDHGIVDRRKKRWKQNLWRLPAKFVAEYALTDTQSPLKILRAQEKIIEQKNLWQSFNQESELLPILVYMRRRGVAIDWNKLQQVEDWTKKEQKDAIAFVENQTGYNIGFDNVWKPDAIAPALESIGYPLTKTPNGQWSIENAALAGYENPVATKIRWARKVARLRDTFAASMRRYETNGRIHCTFNQTTRENEGGFQKGVRYGRLSCSDPNLQQQPSKDRDPDIAGEWRKIFIPDFGMWGCLDYSQQEPRWTTHFAAIMNLPMAKQAAQRYIDDPSTDNHNLMTMLVYGEAEFIRMLRDDPKGEFKTARNRAKCIFLGLCYGEGGAKLCRDIDLPTRWAVHVGKWGERETFYFEDEFRAVNFRARFPGSYMQEVAGEEGQAILDKFNTEVPFVGKLAKAASEQANKNGYIRTVLNRRLNFPKRGDRGYDWTHKALNRLIQGTSAEQTKQAIINLWKAGHYIQLQVHDEIDGSFETKKEALEAGQIMRDAFKSIVPFKVDVEVGPSWGELKEAA